MMSNMHDDDLTEADFDAAWEQGEDVEVLPGSVTIVHAASHELYQLDVVEGVSSPSSMRPMTSVNHGLQSRELVPTQ